MHPASQNEIRIAPTASFREAAALPGVPRAIVQALAAGEPTATVQADLDSAADQRLTAALIACAAVLRFRTGDGSQDVAVADRLTTDGRVLPLSYEELDGVVLRPSDAISGIREAASEEIGLAAHVRLSPPVRHILTARCVWWGVGPAPLIAHQIESVLTGRVPHAALVDVAAQTARTEAQPAGAGMEVDPVRIDQIERLCRELLSDLISVRLGSVR